MSGGTGSAHFSLFTGNRRFDVLAILGDFRTGLTVLKFYGITILSGFRKSKMISLIHEELKTEIHARKHRDTQGGIPEVVKVAFTLRKAPCLETRKHITAFT